MTDLFETVEQQAERIARAHGWIRGSTKRFLSFGTDPSDPHARMTHDNDLVPFYFYNRDVDILDTEHKSWTELCASQPILAALLRGEE